MLRKNFDDNDKRKGHIEHNLSTASEIITFIRSNLKVIRKYVNKENTDKHASTYMNLINEGGLTFVADEFFDWSVLLIKAIEENLTLDNVRVHGGSFMKVGWQTVCQQTSLLSTFRNCVKNKLNSEQTTLLHGLIVRKSFNVFGKSMLETLKKDISRTKGSFRGDLKVDVHHKEKTCKQK